jgi:hypothetical protein
LEQRYMEHNLREEELGRNDEVGLRALAAMILAGEDASSIRCSVLRRWVEPIVQRMEYESIQWQIAALEAKRAELVKAMASPLAVQHECSVR